MNRIKEIHLPEKGSDTVAIFYDYQAYLNGETKPKCELFCKSAVSSAALFPDGFTLRFSDGTLKKRSLKYRFSEPSKQVEALAELMEITVGGALKVLDYYSNLLATEEAE